MAAAIWNPDSGGTGVNQIHHYPVNGKANPIVVEDSFTVCAEELPDDGTTDRLNDASKSSASTIHDENCVSGAAVHVMAGGRSKSDFSAAFVDLQSVRNRSVERQC